MASGPVSEKPRLSGLESSSNLVIGEYHTGMKVFETLVCTILIGVVLYQLATGKLLDRGWTTVTTREERPRFYWSLLTLQAVIVAAVVYAILRDYR